MNPITNFWNHFQKNNFVFLLLKEVAQEEITTHFDNLINYLHQYNKDLSIIIKNKKDVAEIIITANGNPYLFKEVELLVYHAPKINRWKITAFLQPEINITAIENGTDKPLLFYGISLRISEMYFIPLEITEKPYEFGIRVMIKNYIIHKDNPKLREAVYIHLEHLVGEKAFANEIKFIEIEQLGEIQENMIELYHLKYYIDFELNK
jgi:hypothetical protein